MTLPSEVVKTNDIEVLPLLPRSKYHKWKTPMGISTYGSNNNSTSIDIEKEASVVWRDHEGNGCTREKLFRFLEGVSIPACYMTVGLMQGLSRPFLNVYPLALGATEAQQVTLPTLVMLPCTFKLFFGFVSDTMPVFGKRRKYYMGFGWILTSFSMLHLLFTSNLQLPSSSGEIMIEGAPSIQVLSLSFFLFGMGFWLADVMGDSLVAEKAKLEPLEQRGQLQTTCYACRFFGLMVAAPCSTVLYSNFENGPAIIVGLLAGIPLILMIPLVFFLRDDTPATILTIQEQCSQLWNNMCSRAVWQPMAFVYLFNLLQVTNGAWRQFLKTVYDFSAEELNDLLTASFVLLYVGTLVYKYFMLKWSWRSVFIISIVMNGVLSLMQLSLIDDRTFGLSPFVFALGDDAFAQFVSGIQFLPTTIMMVHLCPDGSEGASYAMYTTAWNSSMLLAPAISTLMLGIWDVSEEALEEGNLDGMFHLTILTSLLQISAILFIGMLPRNVKDLEDLNSPAFSFSYSKIGGSIFLGTIVLSIGYSTVVGILNVVNPGWAGES
eukprot:scaffold76533_cov48-Attheya_sp.AAC.2